MKKTVPFCIVLIAMLAVATAVHASDNEVSLELKLWSNAWKETVRPAKGPSQDLDNGRELMAGPSLNVRFLKDWFAGMTYLSSFGDYESSGWFASGDSMKFKRTDVDLWAGYLLRDPYNDVKVGFFVAYKQIKAPATYTNRAAGLNDVDAGTWKLRGPGLGVLVEKNLDETTLLHGSLAYLFLEEEFAFASGAASRFDAGGWNFEASVKHAFTTEISANVGVQFQRVQGERTNGDRVTDSFSGLTAGIGYTF